jgi:hypothetical protein
MSLAVKKRQPSQTNRTLFAIDPFNRLQYNGEQVRIV